VAIASEPFFTISAGALHTCGLTPTGKAYCWGLNNEGQLGDATHTNSAVPVEVGSAEPFVSITAGERHTCGLGVSRSLWCWGMGMSGQLGNGQFNGSSTPVLVIAHETR
jgi:alpha-tubulin suppressor-like RCC1 family protein